MSGEVKFTPGPWSVDPMEDGCSVAYRINDAKGYEIAVTSGRDSDGEEEANATLAAAAPDVLVALRTALHAIEWCGGSTDFQTNGHAHAGWVNLVIPAINEARAAIAKAEGR